MKKLLALGLLLGCGAAWAQTADDVVCNKCVDKGDLGTEAVTTGKIAPEAVNAAKLAPNAVSTNKIKGDAVTTDKLAPEAVTANELASNAVGTAKIKDGAVITRKIKQGAVTTDKLAPEAVDSAGLARNAVISAKIKDNAIITRKIADGAVTAQKVAPELSNAIGTFCLPGQAVVGMDTSGNFVCESFAPQWAEFDFPLGATNAANDCTGGEKYVKRSDFDPSLFVGAELCSSTRYKLFLADSMGGPYYEISDGAGNGDDHCELIGTLNDAVTSANVTTPSEPSGYCREDPGEAFDFLPTLELGNNACWRTTFYECGVTIPDGDAAPL